MSIEPSINIPPKPRGSHREMVYLVIDGERDYQNAGEGNASPDAFGAVRAPGFLSMGEGIAIMEEILAHARAHWYGKNGSALARPFIRKAAAVAVQLMENYGAPPREGHVPNRR